MSQQAIPKLDRKGLRQFGLTFSAIVVSLFGLLLPWLFSAAWPTWPWLFAGILALASLAFPPVLGPLYQLWMRFGLVMAYVNTRIILFLLYTLVFVPTGLLMKIRGRDTMQRKLSRSDNQSYRVASKPRDSKHFERPY
ncbi:MAG: SxtJ family membrane protein [Luminiphilus sp.]|nr:SxtJ family membrane protein [Luminiphilus sp.]